MIIKSKFLVLDKLQMAFALSENSVFKTKIEVFDECWIKNFESFENYGQTASCIKHQFENFRRLRFQQFKFLFSVTALGTITLKLILEIISGVFNFLRKIGNFIQQISFAYWAYNKISQNWMGRTFPLLLFYLHLQVVSIELSTVQYALKCC